MRLVSGVHELPTGVLYGHDGASPEQCEELQRLLADFKAHASLAGQLDRFAELVSDCELHYRAYADCLRGDPRPLGYAAYLARRGRG